MTDSVSLCRGCLAFSGSYAWGNFTILALGVWAVAQRDSVDAIGMVSWRWGGGSIRGPLICPSLLSSSHPIFFCSKALHTASLARPATQRPTSAVVPPRQTWGEVTEPQCLLRRITKGFVSLVFLQRDQMLWAPRKCPSQKFWR